MYWKPLFLKPASRRRLLLVKFMVVEVFDGAAFAAEA